MEREGGSSTMGCLECDGTRTRVLHGEIICSQCGLVLERVVDCSPNFSDALSHSEYGGTRTNLNNRQVGYIYSHEERLYFEGKEDITLFSSVLSLPEYTVREAVTLWKRCVDSKLSTGRNYYSIIGSCIYLAACIQRTPIHLDKLNDIAESRSIKKISCVLSEKLGLDVMLPGSITWCLEEIASKLDLDHAVLKEARLVLKEDRKRLIAKKKEIIVLGILHFLNKKYQLKFSLLDLCRLSNATPTSVRKVANQLEDFHDTN